MPSSLLTADLRAGATLAICQQTSSATVVTDDETAPCRISLKSIIMPRAEVPRILAFSHERLISMACSTVDLPAPLTPANTFMPRPHSIIRFSIERKLLMMILLRSTCGVFIKRPQRAQTTRILRSLRPLCVNIGLCYSSSFMLWNTFWTSSSSSSLSRSLLRVSRCSGVTSFTSLGMRSNSALTSSNPLS